MSGGFGDQVDPREAQAALEGLFGGDSRTNIHWLLGPALLSKTAIKVLLNMAMIGGDALLRGGDLHVGAEVTGEGTEIVIRAQGSRRSEEHTSELQSLMRISYAVFCLKKKNIKR